MARESDVSRPGGIAGVYSERDFDLLVSGIGLLGVCNCRTIELVVLHQAPDIGQRCLNFFDLRVEACRARRRGRIRSLGPRPGQQASRDRKYDECTDKAPLSQPCSWAKIRDGFLV